MKVYLLVVERTLERNEFCGIFKTREMAAKESVSDENIIYRSYIKEVEVIE